MYERAAQYVLSGHKFTGKERDAESKLNGGSTSYHASEGYAPQAFIDPTRTAGKVYDEDAVRQHIPEADTAEEFGHEVLGHIWGEMFGGHPAMVSRHPSR